jgi:hypothetical protein
MKPLKSKFFLTKLHIDWLSSGRTGFIFCHPIFINFLMILENGWLMKWCTSFKVDAGTISTLSAVWGSEKSHHFVAVDPLRWNRKSSEKRLAWAWACGRPTVEKSGCRTISEQQLWRLRHCDYAVQIREVATNIFFNWIISVPEDIKTVRDYLLLSRSQKSLKDQNLTDLLSWTTFKIKISFNNSSDFWLEHWN